jgi:hypothetical protein
MIPSMSSPQLTNILIFILIGLIGYISKAVLVKIEKFEKTIQDILMSDVSNKKDIERLRDDVDSHEIRLVKLEH